VNVRVLRHAANIFGGVGSTLKSFERQVKDLVIEYRNLNFLNGYAHLKPVGYQMKTGKLCDMIPIRA
jgi:hypothetical protein